MEQANLDLIADKAQLQLQLQQATSYIKDLEEKCYQANKTSLELLQTVRDLEAENEALKTYIMELKSRVAVYIPEKSDPIDKKLAEYINNYPDRAKLKIMFMRESEGVYQFGQKRISVKCDRDKISIKVGGGYLSIDEFLDQYTPVELEKLGRRDPLKRMSEKIAVQKTLGSRLANESSPIRRDDSSQMKSSRSNQSRSARSRVKKVQQTSQA